MTGQTMTFKKGDKIKILDEYQDRGDDKYTWVVMDEEANGRVTVCPIDINLTFKPRYVVMTAWIKKAEDDQ
jgi:hypothetical protein